MAIILDGSTPKQVGENVLDIQSTLRSRARERETKLANIPALKETNFADVNGEAKLPVFHYRPA